LESRAMAHSVVAEGAHLHPRRVLPRTTQPRSTPAAATTPSARTLRLV
jgi:hypothetical protein